MDTDYQLHRCVVQQKQGRPNSAKNPKQPNKRQKTLNWLSNPPKTRNKKTLSEHEVKKDEDVCQTNKPKVPKVPTTCLVEK